MISTLAPPSKGLKDQTLYLIDGSGFIFRAFYALPNLTRGDGTPVGAVLGFVNMLVKILEDKQAAYMAVIFDAGRLTFRNDIYPLYKAHRGETPESLIPQFPLIREACQTFGVQALERKGFEADDLIASYSRLAERSGMHPLIVSSDKDLMQLVNRGTHMWDPLKNKTLDEAAVMEKFGVPPAQLGDVLALAGDASDNIPGVPGIGLKTAAELIQSYGSLENLLNSASSVKQEKRRQSLLAFADQARLSKKLVTLKDDLPLDSPLDTLQVRKPSFEQVLPFLQEQGFKGLINRLAPRPESRPQDRAYEMIGSRPDLELWIKKAEEAGQVVLDTETTSLDALRAQLVGVSLSVRPREAAYLPFLNKPNSGLFEPHPDAPHTRVSPEEALSLLKALCENPRILKIGHNLKYDKLVLKKYGITVAPYEDTLLQSYLLQGGRHGLDALVLQHFDHKMISFKEVTTQGKTTLTFDQVPLPQATIYAAEDADYTGRLYSLFGPLLEKTPLQELYHSLDLPLVDVLVKMEETGILVFPKILQEFRDVLQKKLSVLEHEIHQLAGCTFNIGSPKQLGEVLFDKLGLATGKKNKSGSYGTSSEVLEALAPSHPLPEKVLAWRQNAKLLSTYTDSLIDQINPATHRVHTTYAMAITSTGRLSSSDPNLQNIPVRTPEGRMIRKAFVAAPGCLLLSFDYSQIELRLLAHLAQVPALCEAFIQGQDIHALTASQVFSVPLAQVSADLRNQAKAINFGIIYGISAFGLAKQLKLGNKEASQIIEAYFHQYPGIREFIAKTIEFARLHGYVETLWGRRLYIPEINSKNGAHRAFAERQAVNAPLQGSNADIIKKAMILCHHMLQDLQARTKLLLQVHDELIFECPLDEVDLIKDKVRKIMESVCQLKVPLIVSVGQGQSWDECH